MAGTAKISVWVDKGASDATILAAIVSVATVGTATIRSYEAGNHVRFYSYYY